MIITATVGFVLVVVALVLCIGGIVTNSWVGASTSEQEVRIGLWKICSKMLPSDHFTCYVSENPKRKTPTTSSYIQVRARGMHAPAVFSFRRYLGKRCMVPETCDKLSAW